MLTDDEREKFIAHVNKTWETSKACPMCATNSWAIIGMIDLHIDQWRTAPTVVQCCQKCGNTIMMNAVVAGLHKGAP
jgi:hypothetical protein